METGKKGILIRTDGNQEIATGHLMRCLSVAQALKERNLPVLFAVADHNSGQLLRSFMAGGENFPVICLDTDYRNPAAELDILCTAVFENNIGCVLIDSYFVTPPYLEGLHKAAKTAYIDDIYSFDYPVDLIINYDAAPSADFYRNCPYKLLGLSYTPLRKQFRGLHPEVRPQVRDILISTGGTDPCGVAERLINRLLCLPGEQEICYHILAGPMHSGRAALNLLADGNPAIRLYEKVSDMAALICRCDLAVSAAGTTLYELCAAGVPAVSFTMADNQLTGARDMERFAGIPYVGDVRTATDFIEKLAEAIISLSSSYDNRYFLAHSMHKMVDGNGSVRIAEGLEKLLCSEASHV